MNLSPADLHLVVEAITLAQCELHTQHACIDKGPSYPDAATDIAELGQLSGELTALKERIERHLHEAHPDHRKCQGHVRHRPE